MSKCPCCDAELPGEGLPCPACGPPTVPATESSPAPAAGGPIETRSQRELERTYGEGPPPTRPGWPRSDRFPPGTILAGRYRILGLLGRGGMGEVYRADDLLLLQQVALKFLPPGPGDAPGRMDRVRSEVRVARQVAHPNVCRVYDIGEADGQPFISMEAIDGEDLATRLRRDGPPPEAHGLALARQLCDGLEAIHELGILHRDLKPGNVMIDSRGRVRITDFGLASHSDDLRASEIRHGTPAYQAPEQLTGKEVSARSDLYALGLVLFELFTGRRAIEARSFDELHRFHDSGTPPRPSHLVEGLDPAIERAVLRCLERDPARRPPSASAVRAALPSGDALQAALDAGETPSPELVAGAGGEGALAPRIGALLAAAVVAGLLLITLLNDQMRLFRRVPLELPPAVLADRAGQLLESIGLGGPAADRAFGFAEDAAVIRFVASSVPPAERRRTLARGHPAAVYFWYRTSPVPMAPGRLSTEGLPGAVGPHDPPPLLPGMTTAYLDPEGRLLGLLRQPSGDGPAGLAAEPATGALRPDWASLFDRAGLDFDAFSPAEPGRVAPVAADVRLAWTGPDPRADGGPVRVEAAAFRGLPVHFRVVGPWTGPGDMVAPAPGRLPRGGGSAVGLIPLGAALVGCGLLAANNLRRRRADPRGALRLVGYLVVLRTLAWILVADHAETAAEEVSRFLYQLGPTAAWAGLNALCYLAIEPTIRRRWPRRIIAWNRVLAGRIGDPMVGRDALVGALAGVGWVIGSQLGDLSPTWTGSSPPMPTPQGNWLACLTSPLLPLLAFQCSAVAEGLVWFALLFLLVLALRREWLAAVAISGLVGVVMYAADPILIPSKTAITTAIIVAMIAVALRFGLLALIVAVFYYHACLFAPMTFALSRWYAPAGMVTLLALSTLALAACHASRGSRPLAWPWARDAAPA